MWFVVRNNDRGRNVPGAAGRWSSSSTLRGGGAPRSYYHRGPKTFHPKHHHQHRFFLRGGGRRFGSDTTTTSSSEFIPSHGYDHVLMPYPAVITTTTTSAAADEEDIMMVDDREPFAYPQDQRYLSSLPSLPPYPHVHYQHHPQYFPPHVNVVHPCTLECDRVGRFAFDGDVYYDSHPNDSSDGGDGGVTIGGSGHDKNVHQGDVVVIDLTANNRHCNNIKTGANSKMDASVCGNDQWMKHQQHRQRQVNINISSNKSPDKSDNTATSRTTTTCGSTTGGPSSTPSIAFLAVKGPNGVVAVPIRTQPTEKDMKDVASMKDTKGTESSTSGKEVQNDSEKNEEDDSKEKKTDASTTPSKISEAKMQSDGTDNTTSTKTSTVPASKAPPGSSATPSTTTTNKTFYVRTPAHFDESSTYATISFDVSGFNMDQLEVRIDEDSNNHNSNNNNNNKLFLKVSGKRRNNIGDEFVIDRKFVLKRDQLATCDVDKLQIEANLSEKDNILSIRVPKKQTAK